MCVLVSKGSLLQFMAVTHFRSGRDAAPLISCLASSPRYKGRRHSTFTAIKLQQTPPLLETQGSKENVTNEVLQYEVKRYGYQNNFI